MDMEVSEREQIEAEAKKDVRAAIEPDLAEAIAQAYNVAIEILADYTIDTNEGTLRWLRDVATQAVGSASMTCVNRFRASQSRRRRERFRESMKASA